VDPRVWDDLIRSPVIEPGAYIGLGFDGSISHDHTVLMACTQDGHSWPLGHWRPDGTPLDRRLVHEAVELAFSTYRVGLMLADPPKWYTEIEDWAEKWPDRVVMLDTNQPRRFAPATDRWLTAIREGTHTHDGDALVRDHVLSAQLRKVRITDDADDGRTHYVLVKGEDGKRIDAAVADVLAFQAAMTMPPPVDLSAGFISFED
jgi:hypothetical protein